MAWILQVRCFPLKLLELCQKELKNMHKKIWDVAWCQRELGHLTEGLSLRQGSVPKVSTCRKKKYVYISLARKCDDLACV